MPTTFITRVIDGDTIEVQQEQPWRTFTVRLLGIDAPELRGAQCGGVESAAHLTSLSFDSPEAVIAQAGREVILHPDFTQALFDRYRRVLAYVELMNEDLDLSAEQLRAGWASIYIFEDPFLRYSLYRVDAAAALNSGAGVYTLC